MIRFSGAGILLDIEGTTSSVSFVYDVMFPFARRELTSYLDANWGNPAVEEACQQAARDAGHPSFGAWVEESNDEPRSVFESEMVRLMDSDAKATGLKTLQGLIWRAGFESGELRGHLYADVVPAVDAWRAAGQDVRIYSSGSIAAQKLFFGFSQEGDLLNRFGGHYDTTTGSKKEAASYSKIAADFGLDPAAVLFLSDVVAELDAAKEAGLQTGLCVRPGNAAAEEGHGHPCIESFADVQVAD